MVQLSIGSRPGNIAMESGNHKRAIIFYKYYARGTFISGNDF